jgi:PAS domain S-box-containing protein
VKPLPTPLELLARLEPLQEENAELRRRLEEAEETIEAIRCGGVDALVVEEPTGHRIYTLEGAERPYRLFVEAMQQGAATLHADGTIVWCNRQLVELLRTSSERLLGERLEQFTSADSRAVYDNLLWQGQTRSGRGEAQLIRTDGVPVPVFLTFNALPPDSGAAIGVLVTDLTPQRHHEQLTAAHTALHETERQLALVTDTAPVFIAHCDRDSRFKFVNRPYAARFGLEPGDVIGKTTAEVLGKEAAASFRDQVETVLSGKAVEFEMEVPYEKLGNHFMHCSYAPDFGPDGAVIGYVAAITDISRRKEVEEQLRRNNDTFFNLIENAPFGVYVVDADFRLRQVSAGSLGVFRSVHPLLGRDFAEVLHHIWEEPFASEAIARFRHTLATGEAYAAPNTTEQRHDIQEVESYDWKIERLTLPDGQYGVVCYFYDITERKRAEEALRRSEASLRDFLENASLGLHWVGADGIITWANQTELNLLGYARDEYIGHHIAEFHMDEPTIKDILTRLTGGETLGDYEARLRCKDGSIRYVHINSNVWFEDGQFVHTRCFTRDVTERKLAEEALRESERRYRELFASAEAARQRAEAATRAKDDFLAALSHELRTPLNPALLLATSLASDATVPGSVREDLETISRGISLQVRLVDDLLDLTRITGGKLSLTLEPVDVHEALKQALEMVNFEIRERRTAVTLDLGAPHHSMQADAVRLQQIFWNVLKNAVKFTPRGGVITVRTLIRPDQPGTLVVEISDTGTGIAPDMLERIFDSFAQEEHGSVHRFGGLGLGLSISRRLVELHHGTIRASSEGRGKGATFCIELPLAAAAEVAAPDKKPPAPPRPGGRLILLVEDHDMTRATLARLLELRGHTVFPAGAAAEALRLAATHVCDLVISDLGLPDGDGCTLMATLRAAHRLPGIAMSGYGAEADVGRSQESGFFHHLTKPVGIHNLEAAIAAAPYPGPAPDLK